VSTTKIRTSSLKITEADNSTSNSAQSITSRITPPERHHQIAVIIPDLSSLHHIDNSGVIRYDATNPVSALSDVMSSAANLSNAERKALGRADREWALSLHWATITEETAAVYAQSIRGK
jgi:hypothetical protein